MKQYFDQFIGSIKELIGAYPIIKFLGASLLGVLGGSSFITFLNQYAIYNYAISYGGRLPAESVPYIDVAVSILSFAFLSVSFLTALMAYGLLTFIANFLHKHFFKVSVIGSQIIAGVITSFIGALGSTTFTALFGDGKIELAFDSIIKVLIILGIGGVLASLLIWKSFIRPFSLMTTIFLIGFVSTRLFDASNYASFLREIQYGGGVPITAITKEGKNDLKGFLFLTTKYSYVLWNKDKVQFEEIPINTTKQINYHENLSHELPNKNGSILNLFRHLWRF